MKTMKSQALERIIIKWNVGTRFHSLWWLRLKHQSLSLWTSRKKQTEEITGLEVLGGKHG